MKRMIPELSLSRRQFLSQTAALGAAAVMPIKILGQAHPKMPELAVKQIDLSHGWSIRSIPVQERLSAEFLREASSPLSSSDWIPVTTMPAMVHEILLDHGKIDAPWKSGGVVKCSWVSATDWVYVSRFAAQPERESYLYFQRMEGAVEVYLNGQHIASHADVNAPLEVRVSGQRLVENTLVLHFLSGPRRVDGATFAPAEREPLGSYLGPNPDLQVFGVFDRIVLEVSSGTRLNEVLVGASVDESLEKGTLSVETEGTSQYRSVSLRVRLYNPDGSVAGESHSDHPVTESSFRAQCNIAVNHPHLWWPRGYGEQPLYRVETTLLAGGIPEEMQEKKVGFRRISMPKHLHFAVNNVPVFMRGGSFLMDNILTKVWDPTRQERLFELAENANFNTFRVWAERATLLDEFYDMADARGFLVWQDLSLLPLEPDATHRARALEMAAQQVKRLKHHASIFCWCGGNEAPMWYHQNYNKDFKDHGPWPGLPVFEAVGELCKKLDPERYYQISSPYSADGLDPDDPRMGDTHGYTSQWFIPGDDYMTFATEDTRISSPPIHSLERFVAPEDLWPEGYTTLRLKGDRLPYPKSWLPYTTSESWGKVGAVEQFYDATDAASLVQRLGMAAAAYYLEIVERQRRGRPATDTTGERRCAGYIAWKFNDSWPQIYSAKVDYFLEPYHTYYALKRTFAPVLLSFEIGTFIYLWAVNDSTSPVSGIARIQLYHIELQVVHKEITCMIDVAPGQSMVAVRLDQAGISSFRREHVLFATLTDKAGMVVARTNAFVEIERKLAFPDATLHITKVDGTLQITTDKFARTITLEGDAGGDRAGWFFEDNYFDLFPGETKTVRVLGQHREGRVRARSWYSSQTATLDWTTRTI
jgi:beta-mannosidase